MSLHKRKYDCIFVTGTDTDSGKTFATEKLIKSLSYHGYTWLATKPIASGSRAINLDKSEHPQKVNDDALTLANANPLKWPYEWLNPLCFRQPIAPHIAAQQEGRELSAALLRNILTEQKQRAQQQQAGLLIEGAGGWLLPLNQQETLADVIEQLNLPVIVVVRMQLGCLNHALLTLTDILRRGLIVAGWIASEPSPQRMLNYTENLEYLKAAFRQRANAELLLELAHGCTDAAAIEQRGYTNLFKSVPAGNGV